MYMTDFTYDGKRLSDYGFIIASVDTNRNNSVEMSSKMNFNTIKNNENFSYSIVGLDYQDTLQASFDIVKNPCISNDPISPTELSFVTKWLNTNTYKEFHPIYNDDSFSDVVYTGKFDVSAITIGGDVYGFALTFTSNSPFAHSTNKHIEFTTNSHSETFTYISDSEQYGIVYPSQCEITCLDDGDLIITNSLDETNPVIIKNCSSGEVITIDGVHKVITSSIEHPKLFNDFNYNYLKLITNEKSNINHITFSLPVSVRMSISTIRKVGIIV